MPGELETVDLEGVEILEADVRIHGVGSPPEGDLYSADDLRAMATAASELEAAGEFKPPNKIGHADQQKLLKASGITDGELPAAGWLTNQRVSDDGTKLLADISDVPKKVADLIRAKAYRTRSSELSKVKSQKTGKSYDWVVTGLAWLGGKMPAVRTLDDVVALYEASDAERVRLFSDEPTPDERALEAAWAVIARELEDAAGEKTRPSDTRPTMADKTYTDDQRRKFAEATGLDADKVTDEMLAKVGVDSEPAAPALSDDDARKLAEALKVEGDEIDAAKLIEAAKAKADDSGEQRSLEQEEITRRLEAAEKDAKDAKEELRLQRRRDFVEGLIREGRIEPGKREKFETLFDKDPETARDFAAELPVNEDLAGREYGSDDDESDEQRQMENYEDETAQRLGVPKEAVL